jgi:hypothetical protein
MEVDPYELLVRWYLRFNGYLGVENFVVHQTVDGGNVQIGEDDVLAVRFPNSREDPGFVLETDKRLLDTEAVEHGLLDFVVAEVKGGRRDTLNKVWQQPADPVKIARVAYVIQWLGPLADETSIKQAATQLQASHRSRSGQCLFRVVMFCHRVQPRLSLKQITFNDIADFLARVRVPCWQDRGYGARSPHSQWHPFIKELWQITDPQGGSDPQVKIQAILDRLAKAAEQRAGADSANA